MIPTNNLPYESPENEPLSHDPILLPLFPVVHYKNYDEALGLMSSMSRYHKMLRIIGHPGSGKTSILLNYKASNPNTVLITPPHNCSAKDLLRMLGAPIGFYSGRASRAKQLEELISFLNSCGKDITFLIDEADNLCSRERKIVHNIDRLEEIRYIWDHTRLHTSFIFAAPYDLEVRIQKSDESITSSQFYRRCSIHTLTGITEKAARDLLDRIEEEFRVRFYPSARQILIQRMLIAERGGLGIVLEALEKCMMLMLPAWYDYYKQIELHVPRENALKQFTHDSVVEISEALVMDALEKSR